MTASFEELLTGQEFAMRLLFPGDIEALRTASGARAAASRLGYDPGELVKRSALYRHLLRVAEARRAMDASCPPDVRPKAWRAILADIDRRQGWSERIRPFRSLGKGRKQATDGGAWDLAICEAAGGARVQWRREAIPGVSVNGNPVYRGLWARCLGVDISWEAVSEACYDYDDPRCRAMYRDILRSLRCAATEP
jgi:hypothetical protein